MTPTTDDATDWSLIGPLYRGRIIELEARIAELEAEVERLKDQLREPCNDAEFGMDP